MSALPKARAESTTSSPGRFTLAVKRAVDVALSLFGLLIATPIVLVAAAAIYLEDGSPVFFRQTRSGAGCSRFQLLKLRSMRLHGLDPDEVGQVDADHPLITRSGRWIRRLKIDELPQFLNVLTGDMSVVGPRPTVPEQVERYDDFQRRRLAFRPGMTGLAQVSGNTKLSWEDRIALDVWYVDHWSLRLDFAILARTVTVVLFGEHRAEEWLDKAKDYAIRIGWRSR